MHQAHETVIGVAVKKTQGAHARVDAIECERRPCIEFAGLGGATTVGGEIRRGRRQIRDADADFVQTAEAGGFLAGVHGGLERCPAKACQC